MLEGKVSFPTYSGEFTSFIKNRQILLLIQELHFLVIVLLCSVFVVDIFVACIKLILLTSMRRLAVCVLLKICIEISLINIRPQVQHCFSIFLYIEGSVRDLLYIL